MGRDKYGEGIQFYVNKNIPSEVLLLNFAPDDNEVMLLEFCINGLKWLCIVVCKASSQNEKYFLENLSNNLGEITCQYD